ncbi:MAG: response regulator [Syntrophorhabdales bacterium]
MEKKVLLIDDEPSLRRSVTMGLMQKGYETEPCENGMKGLHTLEMFKKKQIPLSCAVVDIRLPDIDGLKLLKVIKFSYPQLPVIIITGHGSEAIAEEAKSADAYLEKPFDMDQLAQILEELEPKAQEADVAPPPQETVATKESVSMYAMVSLDNSAHLLQTYRKLYFHRNVLYCDAVRGDYDLVLLLQAPTFDDLNELVEKEIKTMHGVGEVSLLPVETPMFDENVINIIGSADKALGRDKGENEAESSQAARHRVSSYVMLEIEKERIEATYPALYFNDQVVTCDYTGGPFNIVLLAKGTSFAEIERTVRATFKTLDGVLRIKEYPIITLFEA